MKLTPKRLKLVRWAARLIALATVLFGLPFYFGYGNPLPFVNPDYTLWDNTWLSIFPLMFSGLIIGWKYERIGGYLVTVPLTLGLILGLVLAGELIVPMLVPLLAGALYLIAGYGRRA